MNEHRPSSSQNPRRPALAPTGDGVTVGTAARAAAIAPPTLDGTAIGLASLCLMHCLLLPSIAAVLPFLAATAEAEWIHSTLVFGAFPISLWTIAARWRKPRGLVFTATTLLGLGLLAAAVTSERLEAFETPLTVAGGVTLFAAHAGWWFLRANRR